MEEEVGGGSRRGGGGVSRGHMIEEGDGFCEPGSGSCAEPADAELEVGPPGTAAGREGGVAAAAESVEAVDGGEVGHVRTLRGGWVD